jgi:hypothetical protein
LLVIKCKTQAYVFDEGFEIAKEEEKVESPTAVLDEWKLDFGLACWLGA